MNKFYYIISILLFATPLFSQYSFHQYRVKPDSLACLQNVSVYREFERQGLHDEAVEAWSKAYKSCGGSKKIIYQDGVKFLKKTIKLEKNNNTRNLLIDSMMHIYNERIKHFGQTAYVQGRQGIDLINSDRNRAQEAYELLKSSLSALQEKSDPAVIAHYMLANQILYKKERIASTVVVQNYLECVGILEGQIQHAAIKNDKANTSKKVLKIIDKMFIRTKTNTCGNVLQYIENKDFNNNENLVDLKKIQHLMQVANCMNNAYYLQISERLQEINPTADNARLLSGIFAKQGNYSKAILYLKKAIGLTQNAKQRSTYYKNIAEIQCFKLKEFQKAKSNILKALRYNHDDAAAYMLLGDIYALASFDFSEDKFSNSAVLWLAIDQYNKAKYLDKSLLVKVNQKISYYKKYLPSKEEAFMHGYKNGDKYSIGGWINEETTIRIL